MKHRFSTMFIAAAMFAAPALAETGTAFTYQGALNFENQPYTGDADYRFSLWDAPAGGDQVGAAFDADGVEIEEGLFTADVDFGQAAHGPDRYLQIEVRTPAWDGVGSEPEYFVFPERTPLTPAPYALQTRGIYVNEAGRVGINTAEPADVIPNARLDVAGGHVVVDNNFGFLSENAAGTGIGAGIDARPNDWLDLYAGGSTRATLTATGRLGIGTTNPGAPLHVESGNTVGTWFRLLNTSVGGHNWNLISSGQDNGEGSGHLLFNDQTMGGTRMIIRSDGKVGIGTTAPQERLHVNGDVRVNAVRFPDGSTQTTAAPVAMDTGAVDFGTMGPGARAGLTQALPGARPGDVVVISVDGDVPYPFILFGAYVPEADLCRFLFHNVGSQTVDPPAFTFTVMAFR